MTPQWPIILICPEHPESTPWPRLRRGRNYRWRVALCRILLRLSPEPRFRLNSRFSDSCPNAAPRKNLVNMFARRSFLLDAVYHNVFSQWSSIWMPCSLTCTPLTHQWGHRSDCCSRQKRSFIRRNNALMCGVRWDQSTSSEVIQTRRFGRSPKYSKSLFWEKRYRPCAINEQETINAVTFRARAEVYLWGTVVICLV